jgi:hypothetical protein
MSLPNDGTQFPCPLYNGGKLSLVNDMRVFLSSRRVAFVDTEKKTSLKAKVLAAWIHMTERQKERYVTYNESTDVGTLPCPLYNGGELSLVRDMKEFLRWRGVSFIETEKKISLKAKVLDAWNSMSEWEQHRYCRVL